MATTTPKLLGYDDISSITGYTVGTLRHMKCAGNFPRTCSPGRKVLVHPQDLELWLDAHRRRN